MTKYTKNIILFPIVLYVVYKIIKHIYNDEKCKKLYKSNFWKRQININEYKTKNNNLITKNLVNIPKNYEFRNLDIYNNYKDKIAVYYFIKNNYLKNQYYTIEYLQWRFKYSQTKFLIGLFKKNKKNKINDELIGTIFACPTKLCVSNTNNTNIDVLYVSFLCIKKEMRGLGIAPMLISEMIRRWKSSKKYLFPYFIIEDKPLPNMDVEKKILYNCLPIIRRKNRLQIKKSNTSKNNTDFIFKKIDENNDKNIEIAYQLFLKLAKKEWVVFQDLDIDKFKHYLFNDKLRIMTFFIVNPINNSTIGIISTIHNYIDNKDGKKLYDKNSDIKKEIGVSFIQFVLIDKQMVDNNSLKNINNNIIKQFKVFYEKNNNYISIDYLAHITDYNKNNIISKYIFRKGFIHTYNFSFNYMNENSKKSNMLDNGFMMLHP